MEDTIDCRRVGQIRAAFSANKHAHVGQLLQGANVSIAAAVELAGWLFQDLGTDQSARNLVEQFSGNHRAARAALELLQKPAAGTEKLELSQGDAEIRSVTQLDRHDKEWWSFLERFAKAGEAHGIDKTYAKALASAFHEMADNVKEYAGNPGKPAAGVAAWHVSDGTISFVVLDAGRGVRTSLMTNPMWAAIRDDREALRRVLCEQATSKAGNQHGDGYRTVVQNFVERNGCLNVRSGDAEANADMTGNQHTVRLMAYPAFQGTRVAAWCRPSSGNGVVEPAVK